ncbi:MAG TPA: DUF885 domain-containing protein [Actinomycetes bacterium]|nr:DUF885 domain-containing protein [Actinomycetes bacterium]
MGAVDDIANRYVDEIAELDPVLATFAGIAGHDDRMTDYSPDGWTAAAELDRRTLAALDNVEPVDDRESAAREAMQERLRVSLERYDAGIAQHDLNVIDSPMQHIRQVFDLMPADTEDDWAVISTRLATVPGAVESFRASLDESVRDGDVVALRQIINCARLCDSWTGSENGEPSFFAALAERSGQTGSLRSELDQNAAAATSAFAAFGDYLRGELAPHGRERDAAGRDTYRLAARYFLGADIDLDETYDWAWNELHRIEAEQSALADRIVPGGSLDDAIAELNRDPKRTIAGAEAFRDWMQDLADRSVAGLAGMHFDIPEPIRRLECRIAPTHDGAVYYTGPSEDFSRPGTMWWAVPEGEDRFATWQQTTTVFHEGVPGHHLQIAQTVYRADLLNRWQRLLCWCSGHGEGWALYAERLMADLGWLDDPGDRIGMLDAQRFRAARVVVDIGMHLEFDVPQGAGWHEGERFNPDLGWEFLRAHSTVPEKQLRFELERYLGWPGQAISYKVGERIWLAAREDVRARQGDAFDLATFHRAALDLGAMGLDPLRSALAKL